MTTYKLVYDSDKRRWYLHVGVNVAKEKTSSENKQALTTAVVEQKDTVVQMVKESQHLGPSSVPAAIMKNALQTSKKPLAGFSIDFGMDRAAATSLSVNERQATASDIKIFDVPEKKPGSTNSTDKLPRCNERSKNVLIPIFPLPMFYEN